MPRETTARQDGLPAKGSRIINVLDFGARANDGTNCVSMVINAVEACRAAGPGAVLYFPQGRYDFYPYPGLVRDYYESNTEVVNPRRLAILLEELEGVTLDGGGSRFVFHDHIQPITVDRCRDVEIRNLAIDWQVPLGAEVQVTAVTADHLDLRIDPRVHPFTVEDEKIVLIGENWRHTVYNVHPFMPDGRYCLPRGGDGWLQPGWNERRVERLDEEHIRVYGVVPPGLPVGAWLVLRCGERDHSGIFLTESRNTTIREVRLHHSAGVGILAQYCENLEINQYQAVPSPDRHVLSGHDDGLQVSNCRGRVQVTNCLFRGLMDDPINVHGTSVAIIARSADGKQLRCRFMHRQAVGLPWGHTGDVAAVIAPDSMRRLEQCTVSQFTAHDAREFTVTCADGWPESAKPGYALENLTWAPDVEIRDNVFLGCRARGILLTTSASARITHNRFASSGSAILISGDAKHWYESGGVRDVLISGNTFEAPCLQSQYQFCGGIISIAPHIEHPDPKGLAHRNIRIEGNTFNPTGQPLLYAQAAAQLTFVDNTITPSTAYDDPWNPRHAAIDLDACEDVDIHGNQVLASGDAAPSLALYRDALGK